MNDAAKLVWGIIALLVTLATASMGQLYFNMKGTDDDQNRELKALWKEIYEIRRELWEAK